MSIDVAAMSQPAASMVEAAVEAAKAVDATSVGQQFSEQAAAGIDTEAMSARAAEMAAGMASASSATAKVSLQVDTSAIAQLKSASASAVAAFRSMASQINASMASAIASASRAASSVRSTIGSVQGKTVYVNVARGSVALPHFSMSGSFDPKTRAVPSVSVAWYAKGGIFTQPTLLPGAVGVGEAGPEAVLPIDRLPSLLGLDAPRGGDTYNINVTAGGDAREIADTIVRQIRAYGLVHGRA